MFGISLGPPVNIKLLARDAPPTRHRRSLRCGKHFKNIFESGELTPAVTVSRMETVQTEGDRQVARTVEFYNLDAVIAVGYRVNSIKATHFRIWATNTLREFMVKGFVLDDQMLKNGRAFGQDYFDELLEKIREIRASERRADQKIADVFEQCSSDYIGAAARRPNASIRSCRTGCTLPAPGRPPPRLSLSAPIAQSRTWG